MTGSHQPPHDRQPAWAWLRLCLLLTLWQAPIPLVHAHEAPGWEASALARHMRDFHSDSSQPGDCEWHWHLVLPAWGEPALPDQSDNQPARPVQFDVTVVRLDDSLVRGSTVVIPADFIDWRPPQTWQSAPDRPLAMGDGYLSTWLTAAPLQHLLCTMRC